LKKSPKSSKSCSRARKAKSLLRARLKKALRARKRPRKKRTPNSPVRLVAGLRNPGSDYAGTRHNVGFEVVRMVAERAGEDFKRGPSRVRGMIAQVGVGDDRTLLLAPTTFMNESGQSVSSALSYHKLGPDDLLVVHDDIDLPFGRLRLQVAGGSGGHNGIRSLERSLGTKDFSRLKVGVGRPPGSMDPADYVLRPFSKSERSEVEMMIEDAADVVEAWFEDRDRAQEMATLRGRDE
jgi:PTH1 family peptidyl-tRNA hydrolase